MLLYYIITFNEIGFVEIPNRDKSSPTLLLYYALKAFV